MKKLSLLGIALLSALTLAACSTTSEPKKESEVTTQSAETTVTENIRRKDYL